MKTDRRGLRDWFIITVIILVGFLCLIVAGSMAVRFAPSWQLSSNMDSHLDPDRDYLTNRPQGYIEPVDQSILTAPVWLQIFQTPGASLPQRTPVPTRTAVLAITSSVVPTVTIMPPVATLSPTNTIVYVPASPTHTDRPAPSDTATATAVPTNVSIEADLVVTKDDGVLMYSAGDVLTYTIIVTNNGPASVTGAVFTDNIPAQFDHWSWSCTAENGGASECTKATMNNVDFSDTVDLPNGASIEYTVTARVLTSASGDLVNTAQADVPATNIESDPSNNRASDTDKFLPASTLPIGNIGTSPDGNTDTLTSGDSVTFSLSGFLLDGNSMKDTVYYEKEETSSSGKIHLGNVQIEVFDRTTAAWYMIYHWGNNVADTNASYNNGNSEPDGFPVDKSLLHGFPPLNTGIAIDIDTPVIAQGGSIGDLITLIRITSLSNSKCEIDSMQMLR